ncbi:MAG: hypothetical protein R3D33_10935 [Hyphomicrobiaceae bacterium]
MDWRFGVPADEEAELLAATLLRSGVDLAPFSDGQVAIGLNALLFPNYGDTAGRIMAVDVPIERRIAAVAAIGRLYADCLAQRAPPVLGHLSEGAGHPLSFVTYMLWDVSPIDWWAAKDDRLFAAYLGVLEMGLASPNDAVVESALHGLGHLPGERRPAGTRLIDDWLAGAGSARLELRAYAERARSGCIQ